VHVDSRGPRWAQSGIGSAMGSAAAKHVRLAGIRGHNEEFGERLWCAMKFKFLTGESHTSMFPWGNCRSAELFQIQYLDNQGWPLQESRFRALVDFV
jgi:hypothetical protein